MRHRKVLTLLTTVVLVAGIGVPSAMAEASPDVPIRGALEGIAVDTPVWVDPDHFKLYCDPAEFIVLTETKEVTGEVSHLGLTEAELWHCFKFTGVSSGDVLEWGVMSGEATLASANGDELRADYTGVVLEFPDGSVQIPLDLTVTGGTGRFASASGSIDMDVTVLEEPGQKTALMTLEGIISY